MPNWFTVYQGLDWNPKVHSYNQLFGSNIAELRAWFKTQRIAFGLDRGTGCRVPYILENRDYTVEMQQFKWGDYRLVTSSNRVDMISDTSYLTPVLTFQPKIRDKGGSVVFAKPIVVEFDPFFPRNPPRYRVIDHRYATLGSDWGLIREHHIHNGGWLCIMGGGYAGYSREQWNPETGNVLVGLNQSFHLCIWHVNKFGW